jgi:SAM-dependent methyltransferase
MDRRLTFSEDAANYDKWRPRYCGELFSKIIEYAQLDGGKTAVEVGCGTGQATEPILEIGCSVVAVEYGKELASFAAEKFARYRNFAVRKMEFEKFECESGTVDLVYSATAFHWIPEEIGYAKAYDLLKSGGTIALFWNRPFVNRDDDPLHQAIQAVYDRFREAGNWPGRERMLENDTERYRRVSETIGKYGFSDVTCSIFRKERRFNADDYVALLNTYSDHRALDPLAKEPFEAGIKDAINRFGSVLRVYDTMDLYLAKKP